MNNFRVIYKMLSHLERAMDYDTTDYEPISPEALGITCQRWIRLVNLLIQDGYVSGAVWAETKDEEERLCVSNVEITLKGLEYLSENAMMQREAASETTEGDEEAE